MTKETGISFEVGNRVVISDKGSFLHGKKGLVKDIDLTYVHVQLDKYCFIVIHESRIKKLKKK